MAVEGWKEQHKVMIITNGNNKYDADIESREW